MKAHTYLTVFALLLMSCSNDNDTPDNQDTYHYNYRSSSALSVEQLHESYMKLATLDSGSNLVFTYEFIADDEELIADDEYSETIMFEIDSSVNSFSFKDDQLEDIKLTFSKYCYCYFPYEEVKDVAPRGTIEGNRISNSEWRVTLDVTFYGDESKSISGIFKLE